MVIIVRSPLLYRLFGGGAKADPGVREIDFGTAAVSQPPTDRDVIVGDYAGALDRIAAANRDNPNWWAMDLASGNRFASPLAEAINDLVRFRTAHERARAENHALVLIRPPWPLIQAVRELGRTRGEAVRVFAWPGARLAARYRGKVRAWWSLLKGAVFSLVLVRDATRTYGPPPRIDTPVFLIKSFVYAGDFDESGSHRDAFFGRYPEQAARALEPGVQVLTVVQGFEGKDECYRRMGQLNEKRLAPIEAYLRPWDVLAGFWRCVGGLLRHPVAVPAGIIMTGLDATPMIRETIAAGGWRIPFVQFLHERAAVNMTKAHRVLGCALTQEANPWERMFIRGLRHDHAEMPVHGFQHSVVPQAAVGMFIRRDAPHGPPGPDAILTTGTIPAGIITKYGGTEGTPVRPAGALRYENLRDLAPAPRRADQSPPIVLVALEGVYPAAALLAYAIDQARITPEVTFRIRTHPILPLDELLRDLPFGRGDLPANVEESRGRSVHEDVTESDLVLYWGSTIALEAILIGRPIAHFDRGDALSYDPLFELQAFHWTVHVESPVAQALREITEMTADAYAAGRDRAIAYVKEYFLPVNESVMSQTLPETSSAEPRRS